MARDEGRASDISNLSIHRELDRRVGDRRLDSWKEIGAFFGRDERTVKRWEVRRGLPVHRVPGSGRATVYAYASELERWLANADAAAPEEASGRGSAQSAGEAQPIFLVPLPSAAKHVENAADSGDTPEREPSFEVESAESQVPATDIVADPLEARRNRLWKYVAGSSLAAIVVAAAILALGYRSRRAALLPPAPSHEKAANPDAQEFYLKGEYYLQQRTPESLNQAVDNYTQAIVRDPTYARAYAGLADCYNLLREYTPMPPSEAYPRALAAARRAVALDDSLSGAHSALGFVDFYWLWDVAGAEREFKRAIELDPNSVLAHHWYATYLYHLGRFQAALAEIQRAQILDPSSRSVFADKGLLLYHAGHQEEGIALLRQLETGEPTFLSPHNYLATIYMDVGNERGFLTEATTVARLLRDPDRLSIAEAGQRGFRRGGREGMLRAILARQTDLYASGRFPAYGLARTSAHLGLKHEALEYLRISLSRRENEVLALRVDTALRSLHELPEYRKILAQVGLPPIQG